MVLFMACNTKKQENKRYNKFISKNFDTAFTYCYSDGSEDIIFYFTRISEDTSVLNYFPYKNKAFVKPEAYAFIQAENEVPAFFKRIYAKWDKVIDFQDSIFSLRYSGGTFKIFALRNFEELPLIINNRFKEAVFDSVLITKDVEYGEAPGYWKSLKYHGRDELDVVLGRLKLVFSSKSVLKLNLDIYEPFEDTLKQRPMIVFFHDGAFWAGDKADETAQELGKYFAELGYLFVSVDYRLGFATIPSIFKLPNQLERSAYQAIQDGRAAIRFLVNNADGYRIDTANIFLAGASAGSILALNVAFMQDNEKPKSAGNNVRLGEDFYMFPDLGCLDCSTNELKDTFSTKGVVNMWGAVSDTTILDDFIPVLSFHGDMDKIVPFGAAYPYNKFKVGISKYFSSLVFGSSFINKQLNKLKVPNDLIVFENFLHSPHLDDDNSFNSNFDTILAHSTSFYYSLMKDKPKIAGKGRIGSEENLQFYKLESQNIESAYWNAVGGRVLGITEDRTKAWVQWFESVNQRKLIVKVYNKYGMESVDSLVVVPEVIY